MKHDLPRHLQPLVKLQFPSVKADGLIEASCAPSRVPVMHVFPSVKADGLIEASMGSPRSPGCWMSFRRRKPTASLKRDNAGANINIWYNKFPSVKADGLIEAAMS